MANITEVLDVGQIFLAMSAPSLAHVANAKVFDTIDSTNTYLLAQPNALSGSICMANQQTNGRGRRGRSWYSPPGANIYCSILWRFPIMARQKTASISLALAVILLQSFVQNGLTVDGLGIKWPNDIVFHHRKLAGILVERAGAAWVIGVGINLYLPPEADSRWTSLTEILGQHVSRNQWIGNVLNVLLPALHSFPQTSPSHYLAYWRRYDVLEGKTVQLETAAATWMGVAEGISEAGELLLRLQNGELKKITQGDVSARLLR